VTGPVRRSAPQHVLAADDTQFSLADVVERMFAIYEGELSLTTIVRVVRRCRRELDIVAPSALPEMLERLAHARLASLVAAAV
jgi:hypothetical protein